MDIRIYDMKLFLWNIITFRYLPYILFVICVLFFFFNMFYLLSHYGIIKYTAKEKINFVNNYLYNFLQNKYYFIKYYISVMLDYYNRSKVLVIGGTALTIIIITIYIMLRFLKT
jgi:hypothetical protein